VVTRQQESRDQTRLGFAQVTGWPTPIQRLDPVSCQQPQAAEVPNPNTRTAAHPAAVAVLSCCTRCSIRSNLASDQWS
jgi:hypothetical protein